MWVTEYGSNRISEFSPSGTFIETLGWGVSNGEHKLEACKSSCEEGLQGAEKGELYDPTGIAIANGLIYVVDSGNDRIEVYNEEKNEAVNQWGEAGSTAGKFKTPLAIAISPSGNVWVGDSLNRRLQEFKAEGKFIEAVGWGVIKNSEVKYQVCTSGCEAGLKGEGEGQFASTWGMTFAGSTLYVTDTGNNRVEMINEKSEPAGHFGTAGTGNGQLESPVGIATSPTTGNLYVTDTGQQPDAGVYARPGNTSRSSRTPGPATGSSTSPRATQSTHPAKSMLSMTSTTVSSGGFPRSRATKAPTTPRPSTTPRKKKPQSPNAATTPNGPSCHARPNPPRSRAAAYPSSP